jgi:hypothetical protein
VGVGTQVTCGGLRAAPGQEARAGAAGPHDGPEAAPSRKARAGATETRDSPGATSNQEAGAVVLT